MRSPGPSPSTPGQGRGQILGDLHPTEQAVQGPGAAHLGEQRVPLWVGAGRRSGVEQGHASRDRLAGGPTMAVKIGCAQGPQVVGQGDFQGPAPAGVHIQVVDETGGIGQAAGAQPVGQAGVRVRQGGLLQGHEGGMPTPGLLQIGTGRVQGLAQGAGLLLDLGEGGAGLGLGGLGTVELIGQVFFLLGQGLDALGQLAAVEAAQFGLQAQAALALLFDTGLEVIDAGTLHLGALGGGGGGLVELVPLPLPGGQGRLGGNDLGGGLGQGLLRPGQLGFVLGQGHGQLGQELGVALQVDPAALQFLRQAGQFGLLTRAGLAGILDGLLQPGDLRADGVEAALDLVEGLGGGRIGLTIGLDVRLQAALASDLGLDPVVLLGKFPILGGDLAVQDTPAQGLQLRIQATLLVLETLVLLRHRRLTLQVGQLFGHLVAQIGEAIQVVLGVAHARLGLAAALLVLGDARGLFEEQAQIFRLGLDEARDHALLDDGVAARTQTRAEEEVLDIAPTAARPVHEVGRLAVPGDLALDRDLGVLGVLAPGGAVGVVEDHLDAGGAHRLAPAGAIEDDVCHRLAAQHLGRGLTHDPAHRVDDVGFAAAVRAHDAHQITGKGHGRGVHEGLESGEFDLLQAHRRKDTREEQRGRGLPRDRSQYQTRSYRPPITTVGPCRPVDGHLNQPGAHEVEVRRRTHQVDEVALDEFHAAVPGAGDVLEMAPRRGPGNAFRASGAIRTAEDDKSAISCRASWESCIRFR